MQKKLLYYPILKGKKGEYKALKECTADVKKNTIPIVELLDYTPAQLSAEKLAKRKKPVRTIDNHLTDNIKEIIAAWTESETPIIIDTHLIPVDKLIGTGKITRIFDELRSAGISAVPAVHTHFDVTIMNEFKSVIQRHKNGYCLRLNAVDIDSASIDEEIIRIVNFYGESPSNIDLLLDNGYIAEDQVNRTAKLLAMTINSLPYLNEWRSIVMASASFPIDLSNNKPNSITRVSRSDWSLWQAIAKSQLTRTPYFSDYAVAHPEIRDLGPIIPNMSASLRYTSPSEYIIAKGRGVKHYGFGQTHSLADQIVNLKEYSGETFSPGDLWIKNCSIKKVTPGNPTIWRQAGTNHHLHMVINQLSNLYALLEAA